MIVIVSEKNKVRNIKVSIPRLLERINCIVSLVSCFNRGELLSLTAIKIGERFYLRESVPVNIFLN